MPTPQATDAPGNSKTTNQRAEAVDSSNETLKEQTEMNKLASLSGADFDRSYINLMVKDHERDVKEFERQSTKGTDPDVRAWATKMLPTLRAHFQQARDIQTRLKPSKK
jgi:putative membrane protein